ncbi:MAG: beta-ketoacyl synthase chain length factor [Bacteroidales bacterium]|jgi:hypothetical protein|nr:beta-ketoacyl synthase chain length factor [Bacteroidales bacterium]
MSVYINSIQQISAQQPLSEDWFNEPIMHTEAYNRAIDVDYKQYLAPNVARRLGKILKRALVVSKKAMEESGVAQPEAIITGTGLGCIENTEIFLEKLVREGEELLNPTYFMQSTHNTISSLIAIDAKCHSYNNTYAHSGISFECALQDAFIQLETGKIKNALVGAHDEMTPVYFGILKKSGYLGKANQHFAGETAVAMMLSTKKSERALCSIDGVEKMYTGGKELEGVRGVKKLLSDVDYVMIGTNGVDEHDAVYFDNCAQLFSGIPLLQYKNIFGEGYTMPALGVYAAATCLHKGEIPNHLFLGEKNTKKFRKILCYNQFEGKNHTFVLLSR